MAKSNATPSGSDHKSEMALHFPQITRFFSASPVKHVANIALHLFLWGLLIALLAVNIPNSPKIAGFIDSRLGLTTRIRSVSPDFSNILGQSDERTEKKPDNAAATLEAQYTYWQTIVSKHPDYRDGHVELVFLAYQLGRMEEGKAHLLTVKRLDPNYPELPALEKLFTK